jgi:hypothetical protein
VYFVSQNPADVPDTVLGQLGNRVQHALRAFTPRDQKAVKTAAQTLRANPAFDAATAITELEVGEALVSMLDEKGSPSVVERAYVIPPLSQIGPISEADRQKIIKASPIFGQYETISDRDSAYEELSARATEKMPEPPKGNGAATASISQERREGFMSGLHDFFFGATGPRGGHREGAGEAMMKSTARSVGSQLGRQISRGVLGSIFGKGGR